MTLSLYIYFFSPSVFEYEKTTSHYGIEGYRYVVDKKTLGNATRRRYPHDQAKIFKPTTTTEDVIENSSESMSEYSDNDPDIINIGNCFYNDECTPSGLLNVSACRYGSPAFFSLPHFHKADPTVLNAVDGLRPNDRDHTCALTVEPVSGYLEELLKQNNKSAAIEITTVRQSSLHVLYYQDTNFTIAFPGYS